MGTPLHKVQSSEGTYPPNTKLTIARGTLKKSIKFYRTNASRQSWVHGAYIGPRVKGKFAKNKGGYFGAWVEYGHKTVHGKMTKADPFMERAWKQKHRGVLQKGFAGAEKIFTSALKTHQRRLDKSTMSKRLDKQRHHEDSSETSRPGCQLQAGVLFKKALG